MRLASFKIEGRESFGAVVEHGVVDLGRRMAASSLLGVLSEDALAEARAIAAAAAPDYALEAIEWRPPIRAPEKIVCIGVNYPERNEEYKDGSARPAYPSIFLRTPDSLVGHGESILLPPESEELDYEGEIVLVIGKHGRRIPEDRAWEHVAGVTCMNEGTVRDWLRHGKFNVTQGKNFAASGAVGPCIVTMDEIAAPEALEVTTRINGELRQRGCLGELLFPAPHLIAYISTFMPLKPGDLIATGTPPGAGVRRTPPTFLRAGDMVEVAVSGVGVLRNRVAAEAL